METRDNDDPFFWEVSRVVMELCTPARTWNAPPIAKLPDPNQLAARLTELEIDGEALLTYGETLGSLKDLLVGELGIKKVPQRMSIQKAIKEFQARSEGYRRWKSAGSRDGSYDDLDRDDKLKLEAGGRTASTQSGDTAAGASLLIHNDQRQGSSLIPQARLSSSRINEANGDGLSTTPLKEAGPVPTTDRGDLSPGDHPEQPPKKRQRVAPTLLTTLPLGTASKSIPTEADILFRPGPTVEPDPSRTNHGSRSSYFGPRGFTFGDSLDTGTSSDQDEPPRHFSFVKSGSDTPGRGLQVNRAMKSYLLRGSASKPSGAVSEGSGDEILPLFGESDDEYDEDTWREYEQEEAEREQLEALKKTFLSKDEIDRVIQEAIKSYEDEWNEKKKPKELLKANKLWRDARRRNSRQRLLSDAAGWCRALDARIKKLSQELCDQQWSTLEELKKQMEHFELSVGQRQVQRFRIQILSSPIEPTKPRKLPRPAAQKKRPAHRENDEEILTSDSDDGLDQFITDEEVEQTTAEELYPFMFESAPFQLYQGDARQASEEKTADPAATTDLSEKGRTVEENREHSRPPADDPMEIDANPGAGTDGDCSPLPAPGAGQDIAPDAVPANYITDPMEHDLSAAKAVGDDFAQAGNPAIPTNPTEGSSLASPDAEEGGRSLDESIISRRPDAGEIAAIANLGVLFWLKKERDPTGLLIALLWKWPGDLRGALSAAVRETGRNEAESLWENRVAGVKAKVETVGVAEAADLDTRVALGLVQLYIAWLTQSDFGYPLRHSLGREDFALLEGHHKPQQFRRFYRRLRHVLRGYRTLEATGTEGTMSGQGATVGPQLPDAASVLAEPQPDEQDVDEAEEEDEAQEDDVEGAETDDMPISPSKRSRQARQRKRRFVRNVEAADMRETNFQQKALFESRRLRLRENLAEVLPKDSARFVINETKEDDEELVYVNSRTRQVIKDHQVEGVRFMWNQIVVKSKVRQGCLLAHTMGLGKTMQVVTLLVAIAEAGLSKNKALYKQIPRELRESRTLILCPSGLVDNWIDELNIWTPLQGPEGQPLADNEVGFLGQVYKIEAAVSTSQRSACVTAWQASGGVLVMGYPMFLQLSKDNDILEILWKTPNIVIADEAHRMKNSKSQIHQVTRDFRTTSRIAMTGSPLTNNVADYYHMVSWVAPNYLGPYREFKQVYEDPVVLGLHADSNIPDRRRAVKTLNILRETVSPLVHRMGILALKDDLPQKKEFILYLKLTPLQLAAYTAYLRRIVYDSEVRARLSAGMTSIWTFVNDLAVLLAHPSIYKKRLQQQEAKRKTPRNVAGDGTPALLSPDEEGGDTAVVDMSADVKSELLATMSTRDLENVAHSWKVVILRTILDECRRIGDKVLVFSQHIATLDFLEEMFRREKRNWYRLDGSTHSTQRQAAVKRFNDDGKAEVYLISTKAGGEGLNIHGANRVVIFDFKYVPMEEQQAVGRAYRIGQTKPVFVYWLIVADTFEESVQNRSVFKLQLASRVVDKKNPLSWSKRALDLFPKDGRLPSVPPKDPEIPHYSGKDVVLDTLLDSPTLGESIRRIIMTETFEEEEPDDSILTTDDRKDIVAAVAENQQRGATARAAGSSYAAEQQRLLLGSNPIPGLSAAVVPQSHGLAQAGLPEHMRTKRPQGMPALSRASADAVLGSMDKTMPIAAGTAPLPAQSTIPPLVSASPAATALPAATAFIRPDDRGGVQPPSSAHAKTTDHLMTTPTPQGDVSASSGSAPTTQPPLKRILANRAPIAGAGTMFASADVDLQSGEDRRPAASTAQALVKAIAARKRRLNEMLWKRHHDLPSALADAAPVPSEFLGTLDKALQDHPQYPEDILLLDFYSSLVRTLEKSARFSTAILFGLISAEELSHMKREETSDLVKRYDEMDESTFRQSLLNPDGDKSHVYADILKSGSLANVVLPTGRGVQRLRGRRQWDSVSATQEPGVENRAPVATPVGAGKALDTHRRALSGEGTRRRLPRRAYKPVANETVEGSTTPQRVIRTPFQGPAKHPGPVRLTSRSGSSPHPATLLPAGPRPSQQPQRPELRPSVPQAGDSADNAWVID